jgi:hypothetical protein
LAGGFAGLGIAAPILCFFLISRRRAKNAKAVLALEKSTAEQKFEGEKKKVEKSNADLVASKVEKQKQVEELGTLNNRLISLERRLRDVQEEALRDRRVGKEELEQIQSALEKEKQEKVVAESALRDMESYTKTNSTKFSGFRPRGLKSRTICTDACKSRLVAAEQEKKALQASIVRIQDELDTSTARKRAMETSLDCLQKELKISANQGKSLLEEKDRLRTDLLRSRSDLSKAKQVQIITERTLQIRTNEKITAEAALQTLREEMTELQSQRDGAIQRCTTLAREIQELKKKVEQQDDETERGKEVIRDQTTTIDSLRTRIGRLHDMAMTIRGELQESKTELQRVKAERDQLQILAAD